MTYIDTGETVTVAEYLDGGAGNDTLIVRGDFSLAAGAAASPIRFSGNYNTNEETKAVTGTTGFENLDFGRGNSF